MHIYIDIYIYRYYLYTDYIYIYIVITTNIRTVNGDVVGMMWFSANSFPSQLLITYPGGAQRIGEHLTGWFYKRYVFLCKCMPQSSLSLPLASHSYLRVLETTLFCSSHCTNLSFFADLPLDLGFNDPFLGSNQFFPLVSRSFSLKPSIFRRCCIASRTRKIRRWASLQAGGPGGGAHGRELRPQGTPLFPTQRGGLCRRLGDVARTCWWMEEDQWGSKETMDWGFIEFIDVYSTYLWFEGWFSVVLPTWMVDEWWKKMGITRHSWPMNGDEWWTLPVAVVDPIRAYFNHFSVRWCVGVLVKQHLANSPPVTSCCSNPMNRLSPNNDLYQCNPPTKPT